MSSQDAIISNDSRRFPTIMCGNCGKIWMIPGLKGGDSYECKTCGFICTVGDDNSFGFITRLLKETTSDS